MNGQVFILLVQDGLVSAAIYALLAIAFVLVFTVTRVLFVPQGEFVALGALSFAALQSGTVPGLVWMLAIGTACVALIEAVPAIRRRQYRRLPWLVFRHLVVPGAVIVAVILAAPHKPDPIVRCLLAVALVTLFGPVLFVIAFRPVASASVLVLLIVAVGVHFALQGLCLLFFGAEGFRGSALVEGRVELGAVGFSGQQLVVIAASLLFMAGFYYFFGSTLWGKALRATAVNRVGARLIGVRAATAGQVAFTLAALVGGVSGVLIGGVTTLYYDSGFLIGLKGLVAGIFGGLVTYPAAILGAIVVGVVEAFASFWASSVKELIVFGFLIPVLVWLSLRHHGAAEEGEEDEDG